MDNAIMTLPKIDQLEQRPYAIRDFAKGQGVYLGKIEYNIEGIKQRGGIVLCREAGSDKRVQIHNWDGGDATMYAGSREAAGVAPRFESINSESQNEAALIFSGHQVSVSEYGTLTIDGNEVFFPDNRIDGNIQKLEGTDLSFTTDKTPLDFDNHKDTLYNPQKNPTYKIRAGGYEGLATEVSGTKVADRESIYNDGTLVKDGETETYGLTPIKAKWDGNAIQVTEVITAIQLEPRYKYERCKFKRGQELPISEMQVGRVMSEILFPEMVKSAEYFAILNKSNTVNGLFDQLLAGTIDEDGCRNGLKQIIDKCQTDEELVNFSAQLEQAKTSYEEQRKAQKEQEAEKKKQLQIVKGGKKAEIDNLKF